jgi:hypothetical protein
MTLPRAVCGFGLHKKDLDVFSSRLLIAMLLIDINKFPNRTAANVSELLRAIANGCEHDD